MRELEILKMRYGINREETKIKTPQNNVLFVLDNEKELYEDFLKEMPNIMTKSAVKALKMCPELLCPEIPMLINTIENCYCNIAVYGKSPYAEKIYNYLKANQNIQVYRVDEKHFKYSQNAYWLDVEEPVDILLVMDLLMTGEVYDMGNNRVVSVFARDMYRADLKSTCNNADINLNIFPRLLENGVRVIWVSWPDINRINNGVSIERIMKVWRVIRSVSERMFHALRRRRFHVLYLQKESRSVTNTGIRGISEIYHNGQYINFDNGFRRTPGNSVESKNNIWLFGPCCVRGLSFDDHHTMSAKLQNRVKGKYNVMNRGTAYSCLNYVMRTARYKAGDIVVFFSLHFIPQEKNTKIIYIDSTDVFNIIPKLGRHISDSLYHCDECVIEEFVKVLYKTIKEIDDRKLDEEFTEEIGFGSKLKKEPSIMMYERNSFTQWLSSLAQYKREGNNGAIVMNANPFTYGHRHLIEYAAGLVDYLYIMVVEEDASFFSFEERFRLVKEGTDDLENVIVFPSSKYIISKSSLPGYFDKDKAKNDFLLDASQDILSFVQVARALNIHMRFCGEEPNDHFTEQYNMNMKMMLPEYGIRVQIIPRKEWNGKAISASQVRALMMRGGGLETIKELVPETTYRYIKKWMDKV